MSPRHLVNMSPRHFWTRCALLDTLMLSMRLNAPCSVDRTKHGLLKVDTNVPAVTVVISNFSYFNAKVCRQLLLCFSRCWMQKYKSGRGGWGGTPDIERISMWRWLSNWKIALKDKYWWGSEAIQSRKLFKLATRSTQTYHVTVFTQPFEWVFFVTKVINSCAY